MGAAIGNAKGMNLNTASEAELERVGGLVEGLGDTLVEDLRQARAEVR